MGQKMMSHKEPSARLISLSQLFRYVLDNSFLYFIQFISKIRINQSIHIFTQKGRW